MTKAQKKPPRLETQKKARKFHSDERLVLLEPFLDLLRSSGAITTNKVMYKLRELTYKLDVENKVKQGSEKLESLGVGVNATSAESGERVILLKRALQKYQGLYLPDEGKRNCDKKEKQCFSSRHVILLTNPLLFLIFCSG